MIILIIHFVILIPILCLIIRKQSKVAKENKEKMKLFSSIFAEKAGEPFRGENYFCSDRHINTIFQGAPILKKIIGSINGYLENNTNASPDFSILKDIVDRNCDETEDSIHTLMPMPLYFGLVGTMLGVILGIVMLFISGDLNNMFMDNAGASVGYGIIALLIGVAGAMFSSVYGIYRTASNSYFFKDCKIAESQAKNEFLTWLQIHLLPKLNADFTSEMTKTANQLSEFNRTFAENVEKLNDIFRTVVNVSHDQALSMQALNEFDYKGMTRSLNSSLKAFEKWGPQFDSLSDVLEEMRKRQDALTEAVSEVDSNLRHTFESLNETTDDQVGKLKEKLVGQQLDFGKFSENLQDAYYKKMQDIEDLFFFFLESANTFMDNINFQTQAMMSLSKDMIEQSKDLIGQIDSVDRLSKSLTDYVKSQSFRSRQLLDSRGSAPQKSKNESTVHEISKSKMTSSEKPNMQSDKNEEPKKSVISFFSSLFKKKDDNEKKSEPSETNPDGTIKKNAEDDKKELK